MSPRIDLFFGMCDLRPVLVITVCYHFGSLFPILVASGKLPSSLALERLFRGCRELIQWLQRAERKLWAGEDLLSVCLVPWSQLSWERVCFQCSVEKPVLGVALLPRSLPFHESEVIQGTDLFLLFGSADGHFVSLASRPKQIESRSSFISPS